MADWKQTVKLGDLHHAYRTGHNTIQEIAAVFARRLGRLHDEDGELALIIADFEEIAKSAFTNIEDWDEALSELYDYADTYRVWVDTAGGVA